jgi:uncharacterized protein
MKYPVKILLLFFATIFYGNFILAQTEFKIPDPPSVIYPVNDDAQIFTPEQKESLNQKLISYKDSTYTEIIVCTVKTLDGDDINYVGARWGEKWGIGQKGKNNGILLLIAVDDRRLTIQNGRGTEDAMTDYISSSIINQYMVPYLKQNDFYGAVDSGTDQIINVLQGKFKNDSKEENSSYGIGFVAVLFVFFIGFLFALVSNNENTTYYDRNGRKRRNNDDFFGGSRGGFSGGGFSSGSSGGGFGGFGGGGSFGGGGASGSW